MAPIYLDNAATSWPKPEAVYAAMDQYQRESGVAAGRGNTRRGGDLQRIVDRCRQRAAQLLGASSPKQIVFGSGGTDALNLAIHGFLRPRDHVVTTDIEHNSVLRPLRTLKDRSGVTTDFAPADSAGSVDPAAIDALCHKQTRLIIVSHVSNVTGTIQPIAEIARRARQRGIALLIDAAQSAGHLPIDVTSMGIDMLACSGHKGLLGPLGTGLLYIRPGIETQLEPTRQGGTGTDSEEDRQPITLPSRYESGNHNVPGLVGLDAALGYILEEGVDTLRSHEIARLDLLLNELTSIPGLTLYGPRESLRRCGPISLNIDGYDPQELAAILDEQFGIETRAGLHCSPRIHHSLNTTPLGGTLRLTPGPFTTNEELTHTLSALRQLSPG